MHRRGGGQWFSIACVARQPFEVLLKWKKKFQDQKMNSHNSRWLCSNASEGSVIMYPKFPPLMCWCWASSAMMATCRRPPPPPQPTSLPRGSGSIQKNILRCWRTWSSPGWMAWLLNAFHVPAGRWSWPRPALSEK